MTNHIKHTQTHGPSFSSSCASSSDSSSANDPSNLPMTSNLPAMTDEIKQMLICPISLEFIRDPVTLVQTKQTYDRKSLCEWLLEDPTRCPVTNRGFTEKLEYDDNLTARQLLMVYLGDNAYQPYDDTIFQLQYDILWKETMRERKNIPPSSTDLAASSSLAVPPAHLSPATRSLPREALDDADARRLSEKDEAIAQFNLGIRYANGRGVPRDYEQARRCYECAAGRGHATAQCNLGSMYCKGQGVPRNYKRARLLYELAATQGSASAQCNLGILYENGLGLPKDYNKAKHLYKQSAVQGNAKARTMLNRIIESERTQKRQPKKQTAVRQGNGSAECKRGHQYDYGEGVEQDFDKARRHYELAAAKGCSEALYFLARMYDDGRHIRRNSASALEYYKLAADKGNVSAQCHLGLIYSKGYYGVSRDYDKAIDYYGRAARQGIVGAQLELGHIYEKFHKLTKAKHYYGLAAVQGNDDARKRLAAFKKCERQIRPGRVK